MGKAREGTRTCRGGRSSGRPGSSWTGSSGRPGWPRGDVYITNVVKCRPPENRRPTGAEADACQPYLERQLGLLRPKVVVLLGDSALKRFLPDESLAGAHGRLSSAGASSSSPPTIQPP